MTNRFDSKPLIQPAAALASLLVLPFCLALTSCDRQSPTGKERQLIISADDAGQCHSVNLATIDALERGVVTSASIMPACPGFEEFAEFAVSHPVHDYGVHLTLTCDMPSQPWRPLSPREAVPSLVDQAGIFWPSWKQVVENVQAEEAETELRAQIERALNSGIRITHFDHHMFILYSRIDLFELYVRLGLEYRLPIRITQQPDQLDLIPTDDPQWQSAYQEAVDQLTAAELPLLDAIESRNYSVESHLKREHHLNTIRNLRPGVTELVVHCAYSLREHPDPHNVVGREADARFLISDEARGELQLGRIRLTSWKELQAANRVANISTHHQAAFRAVGTGGY